MITTVTMNASIDKAYYMETAIENGTVMRVTKCINTAGGKGINVARIADLCGAKVQATGMVGGFNGMYLQNMLEKDGIKNRFVQIAGETRSCINILDPAYGSTEYLEPGCQITREEEEEFLKQFPEIVKDSKVVTISGSVPKGMSKDIYGKMIRLLKDAGKKVILDTSGELLKHAIKELPTMAKPNQDEIEQLFDTKINTMEETITYAKKIYEMGIPYVVISLGGDGALLVCKEGIYQGRPPKIEVVNTVGCGDSMVGAFAAALDREDTPEDCLKYAVAVASANAMSQSTGSFEKEDYEKILEQVTIEVL